MTDTPSPSNLEPSDDHGAPHTAAGLDERALTQLRTLDPEGRLGVLQKVLAAFESSLLRLRHQLAGLSLPGDVKAIGHIAHTLKSSSASVGAVRLAQLCSDAERAARAEDLERLSPLLTEFQAESGRVLDAVRAMLQPAASRLP